VWVKVLSLVTEITKKIYHTGTNNRAANVPEVLALRIFPNLFTFHYILESAQIIIKSFFTTKAQVQTKVRYNIDELALEKYYSWILRTRLFGEASIASRSPSYKLVVITFLNYRILPTLIARLVAYLAGVVTDLRNRFLSHNQSHIPRRSVTTVMQNISYTSNAQPNSRQ
jgi:hypothetical protein